MSERNEFLKIYDIAYSVNKSISENYFIFNDIKYNFVFCSLSNVYKFIKDVEKIKEIKFLYYFGIKLNNTDIEGIKEYLNSYGLYNYTIGESVEDVNNSNGVFEDDNKRLYCYDVVIKLEDLYMLDKIFNNIKNYNI